MNQSLKLAGTQAITWRDLALMPAAERTSVSLALPAGDVEPPNQPQGAN